MRISAMPLRLRHLLLGTSALTGVVLASTAQAGQPGLPTNGVVTVGSATIAQPSANQLNVTTATSRTVIDWQSFSIANGNKVAIQQPGSSSITVNEVTGSDPSQIFGNLSSNGRVVLANPNGIWFGPNSHVDVAGLVASTATLSSDAKKAFASGGRLSLDVAGNPTASIVNDGRITIANEGLAALVAPGVRNNGVIVATLGSVTLASGETSTLDFYGDGLVALAVTSPVQALAIGPDGKAFQATIENKGKIAAAHVLVTADVVKGVVDNSINMSGVVEAKGVTVSGGDIVLDGGDGDVTVAGALDATSQQATGGTVQVTGGTVTVAATAKVDASGAKGGGTVQIGGGPHGGGTLKHAANVLVQGGASIKADATGQGDGGTVSVWSDGATAFYGSISAKGAGTGSGGWVETSGHFLSITGGRVDTSAPDGSFGIWLLDPYSLDVVHTTSTTSNSSTTSYVSAAGGSTANDDDISYALESSNVTLQTGGAGGNITVDSGATISWLTSTHLTLDATANGGTGNIAITGTINASNTASTLTLASTGTITQSGAITVGSLILSGGTAAVTLNNSFNAISNLSGSVGSLYLIDAVALDIASPLTATGSATIQMAAPTSSANASLGIGANVTAGSFTVAGAQTGNPDSPVAITIGSSGAIATTSGGVSLATASSVNGLNINIGGPITASNGNEISVTGDAITVGANLSGGDLYLNGRSITIGSNLALVATESNAYFIATSTYSGSGTVPFTLSANSSITTTGGSVFVSADEISIAGTINAGTGGIDIGPHNSGVTLTMGSSGINSAGNNLDVTTAELALLTASSLQFGDGSYATAPAAITTAVDLNFGATAVTFSGGIVTINNNITAGTFSILDAETGTTSSPVAITLAAGKTITTTGGALTLSASGTGTDILLNGTLNVGGFFNGGTSPEGSLTITGGNITINAGITANSSIDISTDTASNLTIGTSVSITAGSDLELNGGTVTIGPAAALSTTGTSSYITINAYAPYSGSGTVPFTLGSGATISSGGATSAEFVLTADEVSFGTAGSINVGTAGEILIQPFSAVPLTLGAAQINSAGSHLDLTPAELALLAAGTLTFQDFNSQILTATDLNFGAAAVSFTGAVSTLTNNITAGSFTLENTGGAALTIPSGITITTTAGGISISNDYGSNYDVSLQGTLIAGGTSNGSPVGSLTVSGNNVTVGGTIQVNADVSIQSNAAANINTNIAAGGELTLGASTTGAVTVASGVVLSGTGFSLSGGTITLGSNTSLTATGSEYEGDITAYSTYSGSGTVPFTLGSGASIATVNGSLFLEADEVSILGTINLGTGTFLIGAYNSGVALTLGASGINSAGSHLDLTLAELANITAGTYEFGYTDYYNLSSITTAADLNFGNAAVELYGGTVTINNNITAGSVDVEYATTGNASAPVAISIASGVTITATTGGINLSAAGTGSDISILGNLVANGTDGNGSPTGYINVTGGNVTLGGSAQASSSASLAAENGDLTIAAPLTVTGDGYLNLSATHSVLVNANVVANGATEIVITYNSSEGTGGVLAFSNGASISLGSSYSDAFINDTDYTVVNSASALQSMSPTGNYVLGSNVDASSIGNFSPIGTSATFTGSFNGLGHVIENLNISNAQSSNLGLFNTIDVGATVANVGLVNASVSGSVGAGYANVGLLAGTNLGTIANAFSTGAVSGDVAGGLVGLNNGSITSSYSTASVNGSVRIGGLVGYNQSGTITDGYATGAVTGATGAQFVGGLVGDNGGTITEAYAAGAVSAGTGASSVGGLAGNNSGTVTYGYWDTQATGQATSAAGTGMTTAQLQAGLPTGFDATAWGIVPGATYPYLAVQQSVSLTGSDTISGTASLFTGGVVAGATIAFYANGTLVGSVVTTDGNGNYSETIPVATLFAAKSTLAASLTVNGNVTGLSYADSITPINSTYTGFNLISGETSITTGLGKLSTVQTAFSSAFPSGVLTSYAGAVPTPAFALNAIGHFTVDQAISAPSVQIGASGILDLAAGITTTGGPVLINGAVVLTASTAIDTTDAGADAAGGAIIFSGTLDGFNTRTQGLTLNAGTTGDITFDGVVGNAVPLGAVTITAARNITGPALNNVGEGGNNEFAALSFSAGAASPITGSFSMPGGLTTNLGTNALTAASNAAARTSGTILIDADGTVSIGTIDPNNPNNDVGVAARGSDVSSSSATSSSIAGNGGTISITGSSLTLAFVNVRGGEAKTGSVETATGGNAGSITLASTNGGITILGVPGDPGVAAPGGISTLATGSAGGQGGTITINAAGAFSAASVDADGGASEAGPGGSGGSILIDATTISLARARARGGDTAATAATGANGGTVTLIATGTAADVITLIGNSSDVSGSASAITYSSLNVSDGGLGVTDATTTDNGVGGAAGNGGSLVIEGSSSGAALQGAILLVNGATGTVAAPGSSYAPGPDILIGASGVAGHGGTISILGSFVAADANTEVLRLAASNGTINVAGDIGDTSGNRLGEIIVAGAGSTTTLGGDIAAVEFNDQSKTGSLILGGDLSVASFVTILGNAVSLDFVNNTSGTSGNLHPLSLAGTFLLASAPGLANNVITLIGTTVIDTSATNDPISIASVDGPYGLTLNAGTAAVALKGAVGANTALGGLTINGGTISLGNVTTTGAQVYNGVTTLNGTYIGSSFTANGVDLLGGATGVTATAGNISFGSTVNGAQALSLTDVAGTVSFGSAVGAQTALGSLTITAAAIVAGNVATSGAQSFGGALTLTSSATIQSATGGLTFGGTINGTQSLILSAGGNIVFDGTLATQASPTALSILSAQNVTVLNNSTLWVTTFNGTISGTFDFGNHSLESDDVVTINAGSVDGRVVSSSATLNVDTATGVITGNSVNVTASGAVNEQITAGATSVSDASFAGSVAATRSANIASSGDTAASITVSGGSATVSGANVSGNVTASGLAQISATANVSADVTGGTVNIQAGQTVSGNVTSTGPGGVTIGASNVNSTILAEGGGPVTVVASGSITGSVTGGAVSLTAPVINENIDATTATVNSPDQILNGFIGGAPVGNAAGNITQEILGATQQVERNASGDENASDDEGTGDTGDSDTDDEKKKKKKDQGAVYDYANQYIDNLVSGKPAH